MRRAEEPFPWQECFNIISRVRRTIIYYLRVNKIIIRSWPSNSNRAANECDQANCTGLVGLSKETDQTWIRKPTASMFHAQAEGLNVSA